MAYYLTFIQQTHNLLREHNFDPIEFEIRSIEITESTNDYVAGLLKFYPKVIALSITQESGRGREGRTWISPMGGIWLSIGIAKEMEVKELASPVVESVQRVLSNYVDCQIKMPNDIMINEKKVAGILVEGKIQGDQLEEVVIGIGINVHNDVPDELVDIATTLKQYCNPPPVEDLAAKIVLNVISKLQSLEIL